MKVGASFIRASLYTSIPPRPGGERQTILSILRKGKPQHYQERCEEENSHQRLNLSDLLFIDDVKNEITLRYTDVKSSSRVLQVKLQTRMGEVEAARFVAKSLQKYQEVLQSLICKCSIYQSLITKSRAVILGQEMSQFKCSICLAARSTDNMICETEELFYVAELSSEPQLNSWKKSESFIPHRLKDSANKTRSK